MLVTVCSGNPHKLEELAPLLSNWDLDLLGAAEYPEEDGLTYADNALIKARFGRLVGAADRWMLADDSGIEVAALGGGPGVQTARWAGDRHVEKMLAALGGRDDRAARYVCELVAIGPDGEELRGTGVLEGTIAHAPAGAEMVRSDESLDLRWWPLDALPGDDPALTALATAASRQNDTAASRQSDPAASRRAQTSVE